MDSWCRCAVMNHSETHLLLLKDGLEYVSAHLATQMTSDTLAGNDAENGKHDSDRWTMTL